MTGAHHSFFIRRYLRTGWFGFCVAGGVGLTAGLRAEEAVTLTPVEITAEHQPIFSSQNAPGAATTYGTSFLHENGISGYEDLAPLVPGLFVVNQSPENVSLNLRGLTSDSSDAREKPRVSVFQDGVELANSHGNNVALFDVDNIVVFKGPQPTRFGAGVQSGAISITDNRARAENSGALTVGVGDYNALTTEAYVNRVAVPGKLFVRAAVFSNSSDGYAKNLADGSDLQGQGTLAARLSLRWQPAVETTADLIFNYQHDDVPGTDFKSGVYGTSPGATDTSPYTPANLNRGSELGATRDLTGLTGIIRHTLNEAWTFTSTSAWRRIHSSIEFDADGSYLYLLELGERFDHDQLSQELRFDYDRGGRFTASTGLTAAWGQADQVSIIRTDENVLWKYLTTVNPPFPLNSYYAEHTEAVAETTSGDVFGRADYRLTDKFTVGGGLRLTQEHIGSRYQSFAANVPGSFPVQILPSAGGGNDIFQVTNGELKNTTDDTSWSGQVDARYAFTPRREVYATVSRGRRPPVLDYNANTLAPLEHAEETVWNFETGIRGSSPAGRVRYDASVFQYYYDHFQTQHVDSLGVVAPFDGGRARGQGFETTLQADVMKELTLFATYGFTDAQFSAQDADGQPQIYAGDSFRLTSRHVLSVGGTVSLPAGDRGVVFFTPIYSYRSECYFEDDNSQNGGVLRQGGYGIVNLRLGYRARSQRWEVVAFMNNAFDKQYLLDAGNIGGTYGIPTFIPAAPRTIGITTTVRF